MSSGELHDLPHSHSLKRGGGWQPDRQRYIHPPRRECVECTYGWRRQTKFIFHLHIINCPCAPNPPVAACSRRDDEFMLSGPSCTRQVEGARVPPKRDWSRSGNSETPQHGLALPGLCLLLVRKGEGARPATSCSRLDQPIPLSCQAC